MFVENVRVSQKWGLDQPNDLGTGPFQRGCDGVISGSLSCTGSTEVGSRKMIPKLDGMAMAAQEPMRASFERTEDTS